MEKGHFDNNLGSVEISPEVIAAFAGAQALECFGIVGMAALSVRDGLVKLLRMESLTKGINVEITDNEIIIDFHIIIAYGVNIMAVCSNLSENVKYKVEAFSGMKVKAINTYVEGVRVID